MDTQLIEYFENKDLTYVPIKNKYILNIVYQLFIDQIIPENLLDEDELYFYLGVYYHLNSSYNEMKKYYMLAIAKNNMHAMNNLAIYFKNVEKNYEEAKKYYLMGILNGDVKAMNNLAYYYSHVEKNYDEAKKYYLMAISSGNTYAMNNLAYYYKHVEKNYEESKKYYLMAILNGNVKAIANLKSSHKTMINGRTIFIEILLKMIEENQSKDLNHIYNFLGIEKSTAIEECPICYDGANYVISKCRHNICCKCFPKINECPLCRQNLLL